MKQRPFVSIVIPVYNEERRVVLCLQGLAEQTWSPKDFEIVVVDNGSTDSTVDQIKCFCKEHPRLSVRLLSKPDIRSSYAARNVAVEDVLTRGKSRIIAFTDADAIAKPQWLERAVAGLVESKAWYGGTEVNLFPSDSPPSAADFMEMCFAFQVKDDLHRNHYAPTVAMICRAETFRRVGFFNDQLYSGGDAEFGHRVYAEKLRQAFVSDSVMTHPTRGSFRAIARKAARYEYGRAKLILRNPRRYFSAMYLLHLMRQLLPPRPDYVWKQIRKAGLSSLPLRTKAAIFCLFYGEQAVKSAAAIVGFCDGKKKTAFRPEREKTRLFNG